MRERKRETEREREQGRDREIDRERERERVREKERERESDRERERQRERESQYEIPKKKKIYIMYIMGKCNLMHCLIIICNILTNNMISYEIRLYHTICLMHYALCHIVM